MSKDPDPTAPSLAPAVTHAITILRLLGRATEPMRLTAISRATGISPSSCFNLLKTLTSEGMTDFEEETKSYRLGLGAVDIARSALRNDAVLLAARGTMRELSSRHDAAVALWRATDMTRATMIALSESEAATRIHMAVGQRQPIAAGATGRALLARFADDVEIETHFHGVRWERPITFPEFRSQIERARELGFGADVGQYNSGVTTVACALADPDHRAHYGLSISIFTGSRDEAGIALIGADLRAAALRIEEKVYGVGATR